MKKLLLGVATVLATALPLIALAPPVHADTYSSSEPTTWVPNVAKGKTIKVHVDNRGSKILSRTSTLWQNGVRVYDWSPRPGLYNVKNVLRFQKRITTDRDVWVPDWDCAYYSDDWYDACAEGEFGYWDYETTSTLGAQQSVTRWNRVRVYADETPGCVSTTEFRAVKDGMTMAKVHGIFGTAGVVTNRGSAGLGREYATCTGDRWSYVSVDYEWTRSAYRVWFKWQYISY